MFIDNKNTNDEHIMHTYTLNNFREIPQIEKLNTEKQSEIEVVANVLPFKTNNYVIEKLIDWNNIPNDPMFILTFPQKNMLSKTHYDIMMNALKNLNRKEITDVANSIRMQLNPHPAGQLELNVPSLKNGTKLPGIQHKYKETCLFFPSQSQTCHAYCTFCFRWPQFVGMNELKFAMSESEQLVQYLLEHPEITDVLFTGGDPMIMKSSIFSSYIDALLNSDIPNLQTIRIGTKALSYWPYRFLTDPDAENMLNILQRITDKGIHAALMAHFNHDIELSTPEMKHAINLINKTNTKIRTQSPILAHINDNSEIWSNMWKKQINLGCFPYYMFVVRDTGAQHYFGIPLVQAYEIFRNAYKNISGLGRTVRGPSMSTTPGKILIDGIITINHEKLIALRFLQGRNPDWVQKPFYAKYDAHALWLDDLKPAFTNTFFFEDELRTFSQNKLN